MACLRSARSKSVRRPIRALMTFVLNCCLVSKIKCRNHVLRSWQKLEIPLEQKQHFRKTTTAAIYFAASQKP